MPLIMGTLDIVVQFKIVLKLKVGHLMEKESFFPKRRFT